MCRFIARLARLASATRLIKRPAQLASCASERASGLAARTACAEFILICSGLSRAGLKEALPIRFVRAEQSRRVATAAHWPLLLLLLVGGGWPFARRAPSHCRPAGLLAARRQ